MPEQSLFLRRSELWSEAVKAPELMGTYSLQKLKQFWEPGPGLKKVKSLNSCGLINLGDFQSCSDRWIFFVE